MCGPEVVPRALAGTIAAPLVEQDRQGLERLPFSGEGPLGTFWDWNCGLSCRTEALPPPSWVPAHLRTHSRTVRVHYVAHGPVDAPPLVLVHGFGSSAYHWRYNIPELAREYRVYALDLVGFGWSDKPLGDFRYGAETWAEQLRAFISDVVDPTGARPPVLVGNSLGGFACLHLARTVPAAVRGLVLINSVGHYSTREEDLAKARTARGRLRNAVGPVLGAFRGVALALAFMRTKRPETIKRVLQAVYTNPRNVDDELVASIVQPAEHPHAEQVFQRIINAAAEDARSGTMEEALASVTCPMLLLWGLNDPWISRDKLAYIQQRVPDCAVAGIDAGHCVHDEAPREANASMLTWLAALDGASR
ncbi:unnamed protein product [Pedinophyceae sp. YPF-701]|nr:unnamed protein product [Pedinophyceae sp. YPF-701]